MFQKIKIIWPKGAEISFEVRYTKGRKPFTKLEDAQAFASVERANGSWAEIAQIGRLVIEAKL